MPLKPGQLPIFVTLSLALVGYTIYFVATANYEFLAYVLILVALMGLIVAANKKVHIPNYVFWMFTVWAILHMAGGTFFFGGTRLFDIMVWPLSETYLVLKFDQVMHFYAYFVVTFIVYYLLRPLLISKLKNWTLVSIIIVMTCVGLGAVYEIYEFALTVVLSYTGVGDYVNNALDLVFNLVGALVAMLIIRWKIIRI